MIGITNKLNPEILNLWKLFFEETSSYKIPIYQRNYSWGLKEIEQLIEDIQIAGQDPQKKDYFLGTLITSSIDSSNDNREYEVVDGQQRLTTLYIILSLLNQKNQAIGLRNNLITFEARPASTKALHSLGNFLDDDSSGISTGYKIAKSYFDKMQQNEVTEFKEYLLRSVYLVRTTLPHGTDLNRYFEIMNTRGKQLQQVDLIKAKLIGYIAAPEDKSKEDKTRGIFAKIWEACADMNHYIQMTLAKNDTELRTSIFGENWDRLNLKSFDALCEVILNQEVKGKENEKSYKVSTSKKLLDVFKSIAEDEIDDPDDEETEENQRFETPFPFSLLLLHTLDLLKSHPGETSESSFQEESVSLDDNRLIRSFEEYFDKTLDSHSLSKRAKSFIEKLLYNKFVLDHFVIKREYSKNQSDEGDWSLQRLIKTFSSGKPSASYRNSFSFEEEDQEKGILTKEVLMLQSMLRITYTSPRSMHWLREIFKIDINFGNLRTIGEQIKGNLITYARKKVRDSFFQVEQQPTGFQIERIVFTYLDYLLAVQSKSFDFDFVFRNSIEHFFPQNPDMEQAKFDRVESNPGAIHKLGNLALVSVGTNSKFSNNMPEIKITYDTQVNQSIKLLTMKRIVHDLAAKGKLWDADAIEQHDKEMKEILKKDIEELDF
ncbi:MAG: DUF262 domain-containing HNH endonuclease family protein [Leptospira sp.]|jgi:hypothetical protein|nr:DUF262 domain-containing HNH endonuclease family protein [Leptospira sp.]